MDLAIIILNWHAADDTIACLQPILAWRTVKPTIWVVDNASDDDSVQQIQQACPTVKLIRNRQNQGFSGGTNRGIEAALQEKVCPILLLNNDAAIDEDSVIRLLHTLEDQPQAGVVGPCLFNAENPTQLLSAGGKNPVLHFQTRHLHHTDQGPLHAVDNISGTAVIIRPDLFAQIGLLDEAYFFSTEMADFCARAKQQGYQCLIDERAKATHTVSRSAGYRSTLYVYYIIRNRFIYIHKFYHYLVKLGLLLFWSLYSVALIIKLQLNGETATAIAVRLALIDGWQKRFGGQNERIMTACQSLDSVPEATPSSPTS